MKFWKLLRWTATTVFLALLFVGWLGADQSTAHKCEPPCDVRTAPHIPISH